MEPVELEAGLMLEARGSSFVTGVLGAATAGDLAGGMEMSGDSSDSSSTDVVVGTTEPESASTAEPEAADLRVVGALFFTLPRVPFDLPLRVPLRPLDDSLGSSTKVSAVVERGCVAVDSLETGSAAAIDSTAEPGCSAVVER